VRLLVSGATTTIRSELRARPELTRRHLGHLLTPHNQNTIASLLATGLPIACDNACFGGLDEPALVRMLAELLPHRQRIGWCAVPDVVADHRATLRQFGRYAGLVGWAGLPLAFVAQDGCEPIAGVPWPDIRCLFIGGSTAWKLSEAAARLIREAKYRGTWVHIGRVNSMRRLAHFDALGADSFDGSRMSITLWPAVTA
jgi:hypothetical protein